MNHPQNPLQPGFVPPNHIPGAIESGLSKHTAKLADLKKTNVGQPINLPIIETVDLDASLKGLEALQQVSPISASTNTATTSKLFGFGVFAKMAKDNKNGGVSALEAALNNHKPNSLN